jgi:hypothetical protein
MDQDFKQSLECRHSNDIVLAIEPYDVIQLVSDVGLAWLLPASHRMTQTWQVDGHYSESLVNTKIIALEHVAGRLLFRFDISTLGD